MCVGQLPTGLDIHTVFETNALSNAVTSQTVLAEYTTEKKS